MTGSRAFKTVKILLYTFLQWELDCHFCRCLVTFGPPLVESILGIQTNFSCHLLVCFIIMVSKHCCLPENHISPIFFPNPVSRVFTIIPLDRLGCQWDKDRSSILCKVGHTSNSASHLSKALDFGFLVSDIYRLWPLVCLHHFIR